MQFAANCIVQHWKTKTHGLMHAKVTCPICRQSVNIILPLFPLETQELTADYRSLMLNLNSYNKKFSGAPRPYMEYIYDLPIMLRHAITELFSLNGLNFWYRIRLVVIMIIAVIYLLSPFDLIPESVYGIIGIVDDFCILLLLAIYVSVFYRQFVTNRNE
jgi:RING finger protein 170